MTLLHTLRSTSSRIAKLSMLRHSSKLYEKVFEYAYNPYKMYYNKFRDIDWRRVEEPTEELFDVLDKVLEAGSTTSRDMINLYARSNGDLIKLICNKDLDCGVSAKTLVAHFGKVFLPLFTIQLADDDKNKVLFPCNAEIKYNGVRVIARIEQGKVKLYTRKGLLFSYPELERNIASAFRNEQNCIVDGELCQGDSSYSNHTDVSGFVTSAIRGNPIPTGLPFKYFAFDIMSVDNFDRQYCADYYTTRRDRLHFSCMENYQVLISHCKLVNSLQEVNEYFETVYAQGLEGLILKDSNSLYEFKRSSAWVKVKAKKEETLLCYGTVDGKDKYEGGIGSLQFSGIVEGKPVKVNVGGLKDSQRFTDPSFFIGKKFDIIYNEVIEEKGEFSLFLPRLGGIRYDK